MSPLPSTTLSNEIWQTILRYTIYVPEFLDPDSFEGDLGAYGFGSVDDDYSRRGDEEAYWDAERIRGTLQCVCKGWYEYLHRFEHRYVSMLDVQMGHIDRNCLKKAVRISMGQALETFGQFCSETLAQFDSLPAQILDINVALAPILWKSNALRCFKRSEAILCPAFYGDIGRPLLSPTTTPALKHIYGQIYDDLPSLHFTSPTLVTADFRLERRQTEEEEETTTTTTAKARAKLVLDLPSLRHLRIDFAICYDVPKVHERLLLPLLRSAGSHLRSLYIVTRDPRAKFPKEVWECCPNLEKFHPGMMAPASPPPVAHPLHTLSIMPEYLSLRMIKQWSNLRRIIVQLSWEGMASLQIANLTMFWREGCVHRGVLLEDIHGNAFGEFVSRRILR